MASAVLITPLDEVKRFIVDCFKALGTIEHHATIVAENLVEADYRGHYSHGMNRLSWYIADIQSKILDPNAVPQIEKETVATALVNGNNSLGAVIGKFCMELAIKKAKEVGIGMVTAYGSNHYGIAGIYTLQAIEQGCIGISTTNTSPVMVPTRAKKSGLGTNPISFGAPGLHGDHMVLDMATTTVALGKLEVQRRKGQPIPEGWAVDDEGNVTTDPSVGIKSQKLLPLGGDEANGGYKGYGLGLMVDVISGILSGSNYSLNIPIWGGQRKEVANLGQAFIAIDPRVFASGFECRLNDLINLIRHIESRDPAKPILIPGDPENAHMKLVQEQGGVCYVEDQHETNRKLAHELNVAPVKSIEKRNEK